MKKFAYLAAAFVLVTTSAFGEEARTTDRLDTAPAASAPAEQRHAWCREAAYFYVLVKGAPQGELAEGEDVVAIENEYESCVLDPQAYRRFLAEDGVLID